MIQPEEFQRGLSQHGYGFQYAVLSKISELIAARKARPRLLDGVEVPVSLGGLETRVDIIYKASSVSHSEYLVIECKRVNPAYSAWCFAKSPRPYPEYSESQIALESIRDAGPNCVGVEVRGGQFSNRCYHVSWSMRSNNRDGDLHPVSEDRDAIERACGQVCLGSSGLAWSLIQRDYLGQNPSISAFTLVPVIVTTANLYVTNSNLFETTLSTGDLELSEEDLEERPWIIYQYMLSPSRVIQSYREYERTNNVVDNLAGDSIRSVAIVTAGGLESFLRWYDGII